MSMTILPSLDIMAGRVVRLRQGDFATVTHYDTEPLVLARQYRDLGFKTLHMVDLDGAKTGEPQNLKVLAEIAALGGIAVQWGGGIRSESSLRQVLAAGASRVVLGTWWLEGHVESSLLAEIGMDRLVLAADVWCSTDGAEPELRLNGWQQRSQILFWPLLSRLVDEGLEHLLCTDIAQDGMLQGPNIELYAAIIKRFPDLRVQASGGVGGVQDLTALSAAGVPAVVVGKALLAGHLRFDEVQAWT